MKYKLIIKGLFYTITIAVKHKKIIFIGLADTLSYLTTKILVFFLSKY